MQKQINKGGIYILEIVPTKTFSFSHKILGNHYFSMGYYYYVGSAQLNLDHRIKRHITKSKKLHWHIDYITSNKFTHITNVYILNNFTKEFECKIVEDLYNHFNMQFPIKSFGNSDCKICKSHLLYCEKQISYNQLCSLYQSAVSFIPSSKDTFCE